MSNLYEVLTNFKQILKTEINTIIPCTVVAVNNARVDVKLSFKGIKIGTSQEARLESGEYISVDEYELPTILDCPIILLKSSNAHVTVPVSIGDTGLLLVGQRDLRNWKNEKNTLASFRKFNINDSFFLPFVSATQDLNNSALEIEYEGNFINISDTEININDIFKVNSSGDVTITGNLIVNGINFATHRHAYINEPPSITEIPQ